MLLKMAMVNFHCFMTFIVVNVELIYQEINRQNEMKIFDAPLL